MANETNVKPNLRDLFMAYAETDSEHAELKAALEALQAKRSAAIKMIADNYGADRKFLWNGEKLKIVVRPHDKADPTKGATYFFRGREKDEEIVDVDSE